MTPGPVAAAGTQELHPACPMAQLLLALHPRLWLLRQLLVLASHSHLLPPLLLLLQLMGG